MKLCEPMRRNINCNDHESLNHYPEASPWLMNQSSHSSGTPYSAHMPFFQDQAIWGSPGLAGSVGRCTPDHTCLPPSNILMHSSGIMPTSKGVYPGDQSKRIHDLYLEGSYQWHAVVIFLFRKQEE